LKHEFDEICQAGAAEVLKYIPTHNLQRRVVAMRICFDGEMGADHVGQIKIPLDRLTLDQQAIQRGAAQLTQGLRTAFLLKYLGPKLLLIRGDGQRWTNQNLAELITYGSGRWSSEPIDQEAFKWRVGEAKRTIRAEQFEAGRFGKTNLNKNTRGTGKRKPETSNMEEWVFHQLLDSGKLPSIPEDLRKRLQAAYDLVDSDGWTKEVEAKLDELSAEEDQFYSDYINSDEIERLYPDYVDKNDRS